MKISVDSFFKEHCLERRFELMLRRIISVKIIGSGLMW